MFLEVVIGYVLLIGLCEWNEDFCGVVMLEGVEFENKGIIVVVVDGIGGYKGGWEVVEYMVCGLFVDYFVMFDIWGVLCVIEMVIMVFNCWVIVEVSCNVELVGMVMMLLVLVLCGCCFYMVYIGDSWIYCLQEGWFGCLIVDYIWEYLELNNVLLCVVGFDLCVLMDFFDGDVVVDDCFLLIFDGVWVVLFDVLMVEVLFDYFELQGVVVVLISLVLVYGGYDNVMVVVVDIFVLLLFGLCDSLESLVSLFLLYCLKVGYEFDDLIVEEVLYDVCEMLFYCVCNWCNGQ